MIHISTRYWQIFLWLSLMLSRSAGYPYVMEKRQRTKETYPWSNPVQDIQDHQIPASKKRNLVKNNQIYP